MKTLTLSKTFGLIKIVVSTKGVYEGTENQSDQSKSIKLTIIDWECVMVGFSTKNRHLRPIDHKVQ